MLQREPLHPWLQCLGFDGFPPYFHEFHLTDDAPLPTVDHYLRGPYAKMSSWTNSDTQSMCFFIFHLIP